MLVLSTTTMTTAFLKIRHQSLFIYLCIQAMLSLQLHSTNYLCNSFRRWIQSTAKHVFFSLLSMMSMMRWSDRWSMVELRMATNDFYWVNYGKIFRRFVLKFFLSHCIGRGCSYHRPPHHYYCPPPRRHRCPLPTTVVIFLSLLRLSGLQTDRQMGLFFELIINIVYVSIIKGRNVRNHHQNQR